jgi:hypothetical protein
MAQTVPSHPEALPALQVLQEHFPDPIPIAEVVAGVGDKSATRTVFFADSKTLSTMGWP